MRNQIENYRKAKDILSILQNPEDSRYKRALNRISVGELEKIMFYVNYMEGKL